MVILPHIIMSDKISQSEYGKLGAVAARETIATLKQSRIDNYNLSPKTCKFCRNIISYEKRKNDYCNQSCGAKFLNSSKGFTLIENKLFECLYCKKEFKAKGTDEHKYCSRECMKKFWWQETKNKLIYDGYDTSSNNVVAKRYLIEQSEGSCQICKLSLWNGKPMPLVIDHINGNSEDGALSNLRVICNNCDAQTDFYKSKNNGNGRAKRRERYKSGKSY